MRIAIQGIAASFHEMAALQYFDNEVEAVECMTFQKLCESLKNGEADFAVMAIENTIAGSLLQNYALLLKYGFNIIGEVYLNIQMNLMALPGQTINQLRTIQSHPIALSQCSEYLWTLKQAEWKEMEDTALAAKQISEQSLLGVGAIANTLAAKKYGLEILAERIETHKQNFTRFLVLSKSKQTNKEANKASICVQLKHEKGSLSKVLSVFYACDINLTKIQSVPIVGKPYEYSFHIDLEWANYSSYLDSITKIEKYSTKILILGEYKKGVFNLL